MNGNRWYGWGPKSISSDGRYSRTRATSWRTLSTPTMYLYDGECGTVKTRAILFRLMKTETVLSQPKYHHTNRCRLHAFTRYRYSEARLLPSKPSLQRITLWETLENCLTSAVAAATITKKSLLTLTLLSQYLPWHKTAPATIRRSRMP